MAAAEEKPSYANYSNSSKSNMICPICCENYNKSNHKKQLHSLTEEDAIHNFFHNPKPMGLGPIAVYFVFVWLCAVTT